MLKQNKCFPSDDSNSPLFRLLTHEDDKCCIYLLQMCNGENRFNDVFVENFHNALDYVSAQIKQNNLLSVLITVGMDKFYSNGLDVVFLSKEKRPHDFMTNLFFPLLQKILRLEIPTIAAINGHAYAGGMVLAMVHDYRIMRSDRGYLCMNEIVLPSPSPGGMLSVLKHKIGNKYLLRDIVLTARRFTGKEAMEYGLVDGISEEKDLINKAITLAKELIKFNTSTFRVIKQELNKESINALSYKEPAETFSIFSKM